MMDISPTQLAADWKEAYEAANGKPAPEMRYESGWFVLFNPLRSNHRKNEVKGMIATLRQRALSPNQNGG